MFARKFDTYPILSIIIRIQSRNTKVMALFKGFHSIFRYLGLIGAIFAIVQAVLCIILAVVGILFYIIQPDISDDYPIGHAYCFLYFSCKSKLYGNYIDPIFFHIVMWLAVIIYGVWIYFSTVLLKVFYEWNNNEDINLVADRWIYTTMAVCIFDVIIFLFFLVEMHLIINDKDLQREMKGKSIESRSNLSMNYKDEFLKNQEVIETLLKAKAEKLDILRSMGEEEEKRSIDINPFVQKEQNILNDTYMYDGDYDSDYIKMRAEKLNVTSDDEVVVHAVSTWNVAPPAIVMTVVMKTYIGWIANVIIIIVMHNLNEKRDSQMMMLSAPKS